MLRTAGDPDVDPVVDPVVRAEPPPEPDAKAFKEAAAIASQKLQARLDDTLRRHVHCASLIAFWFGFGVSMIGVGVWIFHLLTPLAWHFLAETQQRELQTLVITAIGSSLITDYGRRLLNKIGPATDE